MIGVFAEHVNQCLPFATGHSDGPFHPSLLQSEGLYPGTHAWHYTVPQVAESHSAVQRQTVQLSRCCLSQAQRALGCQCPTATVTTSYCPSSMSGKQSNQSLAS